MAVVAQIINDAPANTLDYLLYPEQSYATQSYILQQLDNYQNLFHETEQQYMQKARQLYDSIHNSQTARAARAAIRSVKGILRPDVICEMLDLEDVRSAQPVMQRFIMAQPTIRQLYQQQRCDGYHEGYYDAWPNQIKDNHYDYQLVMNGIIQEFTDSDGNDCWKATNYVNDLLPNDRELDFTQKVDILHTWEIVEMAITAGLDPTDLYEGRL